MRTPSPKPSFFSIAAWYCWVAPLAATAIAITLFSKEGDTRHHPLGDPAVDIAFYVSISGLVLGVASLFGIRRHGARVILWKALLGIVVSCLCGFYGGFGGEFWACGRGIER